LIVQEKQLCQQLFNRITANNLSCDVILAFKVGNFEVATNVFLNIVSDLDYCYNGSMDNMKFLRGTNGNIDMVYVSFDCESG